MLTTIEIPQPPDGGLPDAGTAGVHGSAWFEAAGMVGICAIGDASLPIVGAS